MPTLTQRATRAASDAWRRVSSAWAGAGGIGRGLYGTGGGVVTPATAPIAPDGKLRGVNEWAWRDALYSGDAYLPRCYGGGAAGVLKSLGRWNSNVEGWETKSRILPHFNGFRSIVDVYQHALGGRLGDGLEIDETANGEPVYPDLPDLIGRLWRWSNLDAEKDPLVQTVANQGTAGLAVVYQSGDTADAARVYLRWDDPRYIKSVQTDARGNVRHVVLCWDEVTTDEDGREADRREVRTELSADEFSLQYDGEEQLMGADRKNGLGVCPYALMRQRPRADTPFGLHTYAGSEQAIHALNYGASELGSSVWDLIYPTWFATGGGALPNRPWTLDKSKLVYVQTQPNTPPPRLDPLVPNVPVLPALAYVQQLADWLLAQQPELVWASIRLLAGISGETLARVQQPTEGVVLRARMLYEDALVRSFQTAVSVGIYHGLPGFDLGTGTGTKEAADAAYDDGQGPEAFAFKKRPALPLTPAAAVAAAGAGQAEQQAKAATAAGLDGIVDRQYQLKNVLGLPDDEVKRIIAAQATQDVLPPGGAADGPQQQQGGDNGGGGTGQDLSALTDDQLIAHATSLLGTGGGGG